MKFGSHEWQIALGAASSTTGPITPADGPVPPSNHICEEQEEEVEEQEEEQKEDEEQEEQQEEQEEQQEEQEERPRKEPGAKKGEFYYWSCASTSRHAPTSVRRSFSFCVAGEGSRSNRFVSLSLSQHMSATPW